MQAIKSKNENIKEVTNFVKEPLSIEAKALSEEIGSMQEDVNYKKLKFTSGNNLTYDFSNYKTFNESFRDIYYKNTSIDKAEQKQDEFDAVVNALSEYSPRDQKYVETKNKLLDNAKNFYKGRKKLLKG